MKRVRITLLDLKRQEYETDAVFVPTTGKLIAATENAPGSWNVTHVPTKMAISSAHTQREAVRIGRAFWDRLKDDSAAVEALRSTDPAKIVECPQIFKARQAALGLPGPEPKEPSDDEILAELKVDEATAGKLKKLAKDMGQTVSGMLDSASVDSVAPGICINEGCNYSTDVEPDSRGSRCEICGSNSVKSCLVLAGIM